MIWWSFRIRRPDLFDENGHNYANWTEWEKSNQPRANEYSSTFVEDVIVQKVLKLTKYIWYLALTTNMTLMANCCYKRNAQRRSSMLLAVDKKRNKKAWYVRKSFRSAVLKTDSLVDVGSRIKTSIKVLCLVVMYFPLLWCKNLLLGTD